MANGNSDLLLLENQVKVEAWDLCLDSKDPNRRKNDTPHRRALVHDVDDCLTINYAKDYPKGVKIQGDTIVDGNLAIQGAKIHGNLEIQGQITNVLRVGSLEAPGGPIFGKMMIITGDVLVLNGKSIGLKGEESISVSSQDLILNNDKVQESSASERLHNFALSHTVGDKLVINRGGGYRGGVEIEGSVNIKENLIIGSPSIAKNPFVNLSADSIKVNNVQVDQGSVTIKENIDLVQEILKLRKEISELKNRIKALVA